MAIVYKLKNYFVSIAIFFLLAIVLKTNLSAATYSISPASGNFSIGCTSSIDIIINATAESTNAAEIEITYDPSKINIIDQNPSASGIQIMQGDAFNAYLINNVNTGTGKINLAAANFFSNLTSQKLFAKIIFTPLPGATTSSFITTFTGVGNTTDSNIADSSTNNDILTAVTNGSFSYSVGACANDTQNPSITFTSPTQGQTGVAIDSNISLNISDNISGIDLTSIAFIVDGVTYTPSSPEVSQSGSALSYNFIINPNKDFTVGSAVTVTVNAKDNSGNLRTSTLIFNQPVVTPPPSPQTDTTAPVVTFISPTNMQTGIKLEDPISFSISDAVGFDINSLQINLNNQIYTSSDTEVTSTGNITNITYSFIPRLPIKLNNTNILTVSGKDTSGNAFERTILFNVPADQIDEPAECPIVDIPVSDNPDLPSFGNSTPCEYFLITPRTEQVVDNLFKGDDQLLKDTVFENTFIDQAVSESGVSAISSMSVAFLLLTNLLPFLAAPGLLLEYIRILFGKRKTNPWGVITDLSTGRPISFAVCQLYLKGSNYKISQTVSDLNGRYSFITDPGQYRLEVSQSGYKKFVKDIIIDADTKKQNEDIRLMSFDKQSDYVQSPLSKIIQVLRKVYHVILNFLFIFGFISSLIAFLISRNIVNVVFLLFYSVILIVLINRSRNVSKGKSSVVDSTTKFRIPYAQVKIYDPKNFRLIDSIVTNFNGYFDYFGEPGEYLVLIVARGYKFPGKNNIYPLSKKGFNSMVSINFKRGNNILTFVVDPIEYPTAEQELKNLDKPRLESPFGGSKKKPALPELTK